MKHYLNAIKRRSQFTAKITKKFESEIEQIKKGNLAKNRISLELKDIFENPNDYDDDYKESYFKLFSSSLLKTKRLEEDINMILFFLNELPNLTKKIKKNKSDDFNFMLHIVKKLEYSKVRKNNFLFKMGDDADKIYIVLKGVLKIILPISFNTYLNEITYLKYLLIIYIAKDNNLIDKILADNKSQPVFEFYSKYFYEIAESLIDLLIGKYESQEERDDLCYKIIVNEKIEEFDDVIIKFVEKCKMKLNKNKTKIFGRLDSINNNNNSPSSPYKIKKNANNFLKNHLEQFSLKSGEYQGSSLNVNFYLDFISKFVEESFSKCMSVYSNLDKIKIPEDCPNKKDYYIINECTIHKYNLIKTISQGEIFGNLGLDSIDMKRSATVVTVNCCHFATISKDIYFKGLKLILDKELKNDLYFLTNLFIFNHIPARIFKQSYFNNFYFKTYFKGDMIFKQGEVNDALFITKEGEFELSGNFTFKGILDLLFNYNKELEYLYSNLYPYDEKKVNYFKIEAEKIEHEIKQIKSKEENCQFHDRMHPIKIYIIKDMEILGLLSTFRTKHKNLKFNLVVVKANSKVVEIQDNNLKLILNTKINKSKGVENDIILFSIKKSEMLVDRLLEIKNTINSIYNKNEVNVYNKNINKPISKGPEIINLKMISNYTQVQFMKKDITTKKKSNKSKSVIFNNELLDKTHKDKNVIIEIPNTDKYYTKGLINSPQNSFKDIRKKKIMLETSKSIKSFIDFKYKSNIDNLLVKDKVLKYDYDSCNKSYINDQNYFRSTIDYAKLEKRNIFNFLDKSKKIKDNYFVDFLRKIDLKSNIIANRAQSVVNSNYQKHNKNITNNKYSVSKSSIKKKENYKKLKQQGNNKDNYII